MNNSQPAAVMAAPSAANQVCELLRNLCKAKRDIDRFYESSTTGIMRDIPEHYLSVEGHLCIAVSELSECAGLYLGDEFLNAADHE